jgi:hypothetical protein
MKRAKRNSRRPPPGWTVVGVWIAYAPDDFEERTGITCAGDGETFPKRSQAVLAAWDEVEDDERKQEGKT